MVQHRDSHSGARVQFLELSLNFRRHREELRFRCHSRSCLGYVPLSSGPKHLPPPGLVIFRELDLKCKCLFF